MAFAWGKVNALTSNVGAGHDSVLPVKRQAVIGPILGFDASGDHWVTPGVLSEHSTLGRGRPLSNPPTRNPRGHCRGVARGRLGPVTGAGPGFMWVRTILPIVSHRPPVIPFNRYARGVNRPNGSSQRGETQVFNPLPGASADRLSVSSVQSSGQGAGGRQRAAWGRPPAAWGRSLERDVRPHGMIRRETPLATRKR